MNAEQNRLLLQSIFEEMAKGNLRALSDAMTEEFRWIFPGDWSWAGTWEPKSVVLRDLLAPLMAQLVDYRSHAHLVLADGDRVVVQATGHATTRRGEAYDQTYCYLFGVADGRLTEVIEYCNTALVERVLERPMR